MPQGLGGFSDVHQGRNVILAGGFSGLSVHLNQFFIIPGGDRIKIITTIALFRGAGYALESLKDGINIFFYHLKLVGHRNAVAVIINGDHSRRVQHADGVHSLPE